MTTGRAITIEVDGGRLAGVYFGGTGPDVLLVHGTGHNAAAWGDVARRLDGQVHAVAVDLRGHGRSAADSREAEQYWRDLEAVIGFLRWSRPVLVGHSTGAYAVTAAAASGIVEPAALVLVDGFVLDDRDTAAAAHASMRAPEALDRLRTGLAYGWTGDHDQKEELVRRWIREAPDDWLNTGADAALVEQVARRSLVRDGTRWLRRPTIEEVTAVSAPDPGAAVFPSVDVYEQLDVPATMVLATDGFYASRRAEVATLTAADERRTMVEIESNHNVPMTRPAELAQVILDRARR